MTTWSYLKNTKDTHVTTDTTPPWLKVSNCGGVPTGITKSKFASWCGDVTTDHVFYSLAEGLIPSARVALDNPPRKLYGLAIDYDSDKLPTLTDQECIDMIKDAVTKGGVHPNHMSRTFSNKVRLIWLFEKALPGDPDDLLKASIAEIASRCKMRHMLPGLDDTCLEPNHYFEQGTNWIDFGKPELDSTIVAGCVFQAGTKLGIKADSSVALPLDKVEDEINARFPGRIMGSIQVGTRVPLFWINDGIQRIGGVIVENGVVCYSDRSSKGFMSWKDIFGAAFVKGYEDKVIESVLTHFAYDGNRYWIKTTTGEWHDHPKENLTPRLKKAGFSDSRVKGAPLSPVEEATLVIQDQRRIDGAAPFIYNPQELVDYQGKRYINTSVCEAMKPSGTGEVDHSRWPFIFEYLHGFLEPDPEYKTHPLDHLLSWMKRSWQSAYEGHPLSGQMLILAGDADTGKTLFAKQIMGKIMGASADASSYVMGMTQFNKELLDSGVWRIDDAPPMKSDADHAKFTDHLKKLVANGECAYRAMYRDQTTVAWKGRIILTCNMDAASQGILPNLGLTVLDKMLLFKVRSRAPGFFPADVEEIIGSELPYFLDWLLNTYTTPAGVKATSARMGVEPFHHGELVYTVRSMSAEQNLADLIEIWAAEMRAIGQTHWKGNPTSLQATLNQSEMLRGITPKSSIAMGRYLKKLRENQYWRLTWHNGSNANVYEIDLAENPPD
jgi:Family of unknown function (DUF5906)